MASHTGRARWEKKRQKSPKAPWNLEDMQNVRVYKMHEMPIPVHFWCYETPRVKPALRTRGGTAANPTKAPTFAPRCLVSKTCGAWPRFPEPRTTEVFLRRRVGGHFFVVVLS